jgi:hypothetical protein
VNVADERIASVNNSETAQDLVCAAEGASRLRYRDAEITFLGCSNAANDIAKLGFVILVVAR